MSAIVPFDFQGDELLLVDVDGKPHIVLKPAFESLGLNADHQVQKVQRQAWSCTGVTQVQVGSQRRNVVTADVRTFLMALATIPASRVSEDARPKLIAYQSEIADAIEQYWTEGVVINPRVPDEEIDARIARAKATAGVLKELKGIVDPRWLDAKGRHIAAQALGEEPEIDPAFRPLTVGEFLEGKGIRGRELRSVSTRFGKKLKAAFVDRYDRQPPVVERFIDGALRDVAGYTEKHRPLFEQVWREISGGAA